MGYTWPVAWGPLELRRPPEQLPVGARQENRIVVAFIS